MKLQEQETTELESGFPGLRWKETFGYEKWLQCTQALKDMCIYFEYIYCNFIHHVWINPQGGYIQGMLNQLQMSSIPCSAAHLCPFKWLLSPCYMPGTGHTCRDQDQASVSQHLRSGYDDHHSDEQYRSMFGGRRWRKWVTGSLGKM